MESTERYRALQHGDMLNWYRIERILGRGGFGVIYLATDTNLDHLVAIKEFVPGEIAIHATQNRGAPTEQEAGELHRWGLERFLREARNLVKFKHPNIVRVSSVFEQNNTAYIVMDFEEGEDLRSYFARPENIEEARLKALILPIAEGLVEVHRRGFIHRDIKPSNILVRRNGTPVLLDFGSARDTSSVSDSAFTALVSAGFAPLEQYSSDGDQQQGPWTDIYALGGVLYSAVCGCDPIDSTRRGVALFNGGRDPLTAASAFGEARYSPAFLAAIDWALAFRIADRPQTLADWMPALLAESGDAASHRQAALDLAPPISTATAGPLSDQARVWLEQASTAGAARRSRRVDTRSQRQGAGAGRLSRRVSTGQWRSFEELEADIDRSRRPSKLKSSVTSRRVGTASEPISKRTGESERNGSFGSVLDSLIGRLKHQVLRRNRHHRARRRLRVRTVLVLGSFTIALAVWITDRIEDWRQREQARELASAEMPDTPVETPDTPVETPDPDTPNELSASAGESIGVLREPERPDTALDTAGGVSPSSSDVAFALDPVFTVDSSSEEQQTPPQSRALTPAERRAAERLAATERAEAKQRRLEAQRLAELAYRQQLDRSLAAGQAAIDAGDFDAARDEVAAARSLKVEDPRIAELEDRLEQVTEQSQQPVGDEEFERVVRRFNALAKAIESGNVQRMNRLTSPSNENTLFGQLIANFDSLDIEIIGVRVRNADKTISATLRIKNMERANGAMATPSSSYQDRVISSRRVNGEWSLIEW